MTSYLHGYHRRRRLTTRAATCCFQWRWSGPSKGSRRSRLAPHMNRTMLGHQLACPVSGSGAGAGGTSATDDGSLPPPPEPGLLVGAGPGGTVGGTVVGGTGVGTGEVGAGVKPAWTDWAGIVRLPARMHIVAVIRAMPRSHLMSTADCLVIVASMFPLLPRCRLFQALPGAVAIHRAGRVLFSLLRRQGDIARCRKDGR